MPFFPCSVFIPQSYRMFIFFSNTVSAPFVVFSLLLESIAEQYLKANNQTVGFYDMDTLNETGTSNFFYWTVKDKGVLLQPGEQIVFEVPEEFRKTTKLDSITLLHRKAKENSEAMKSIKEMKGADGKVHYAWDFQPVFHEVSCRSTKDGKWYIWNGSHGRTKYGEPRSYRDPETDHRVYAQPRDIDDPDWEVLDNASKWMFNEEEVSCDLILVKNVSPKKQTSAVGRVHGINVVYRPFRGKVSHHLEDSHIFSKGTMFADPDWNVFFPKFGGGKDLLPAEVDTQKAIYPDAITINLKKHEWRHITPWLTINKGGLIIRLRAGEAWAGCEIAMGDTVYDENKAAKDQLDRDGEVGQLGEAIVYAFLRDRNSTLQNRVWVTKRFEVQPASVLRLAPPSMKFILTPEGTDPENKFSSTYVRVDSIADASKVMGVRCQYYRQNCKGCVVVPGARDVNYTTKFSTPGSNDSKNTTASATSGTSSNSTSPDGNAAQNSNGTKTFL